MTQFKPGDRVRAYMHVNDVEGGVCVRSATIEHMRESKKGTLCAYIRLDKPYLHTCGDCAVISENVRLYVHPNQLRKLKPKREPREWTLCKIENYTEVVNVSGSEIKPGEKIHVREVLRPKKVKP